MVERLFATIYSQMRAMVTHTGLHENFKTGIWPECAATATKLENIMIKTHEEKYAHEKFYGKISDYTKYLSNFVEMGVIRSIATVKEKLEYQLKACMFLGYVQNHTGGTYRMLNLHTKHIVLSRDIIWIKKNYGE